MIYSKIYTINQAINKIYYYTIFYLSNDGGDCVLLCELRGTLPFLFF